MPADPKWTTWLFASTAYVLKNVAQSNQLPVPVEHLDERTDAFMRASDRCEIRITGPFTKELSKGYHRLLLDVNVLLTSRYDGASKNQYNILKFAGLFHGALSMPIPVWNYGPEDDGQTFIGCLLPVKETKVFNFGQMETDKLKQTVIDGHYEMLL